MNADTAPVQSVLQCQRDASQPGIWLAIGLHISAIWIVRAFATLIRNFPPVGKWADLHPSEFSLYYYISSLIAQILMIIFLANRYRAALFSPRPIWPSPRRLWITVAVASSLVAYHCVQLPTRLFKMITFARNYPEQADRIVRDAWTKVAGGAEPFDILFASIATFITSSSRKSFSLASS